MPRFFEEGNRPTPNDNEMRSLSKIVDLLYNSGGSSGGGVMPASGANYRFHAADTKLELKNSDTGKYNPLTDTGTQGNETIGLDTAET